MTAAAFRLDITREMFRVQRQRRDEIRASLATPVAALAFSVFNLATLAPLIELRAPTAFDLAAWGLALAAVLALIGASLLIVRVEWRFIYLDPPDLEAIVAAERQLAERVSDPEERLDRLRDFMAGAYDIGYRRYFAENEQRARDRTYGLRLIILALGLLMLAFALVPLAGGAG
jgi:hypothetical protein